MATTLVFSACWGQEQVRGGDKLLEHLQAPGSIREMHQRVDGALRAGNTGGIEASPGGITGEKENRKKQPAYLLADAHLEGRPRGLWGCQLGVGG